MAAKDRPVRSTFRMLGPVFAVARDLPPVFTASSSLPVISPAVWKGPPKSNGRNWVSFVISTL